MDAKQLPHEFYTTFGSKETAVEELRRNRDELWRTRKNAETLMQIWHSRRGILTGAAEQRRCVAVLWSKQVDAAALAGADAKVDGGGGVRALRRREEEDDRKGENEKKTWSCLFIGEAENMIIQRQRRLDFRDGY